jgi:hypothetical protein
VTWVAGYDSVNPGAIPANAPVVLGYVNGRYRWSPADWARFATPYRKTISVLATEPADFLDVEQYDATPDQAPDWVRLAQRAGVALPGLYCSRLGTWPATQVACRGLAVAWWVADYTGSPHLVPGSVQTQWEDAGPYDLSVVDSTWLASGGAPKMPGLNAPVIALRPTPTGAGYYLFATDGGVFTKGDAVFYGSGVGTVVGTIYDADVTPSGKGYWLVNTAGQVYAFGDALYEGNAP